MVNTSENNMYTSEDNFRDNVAFKFLEYFIEQKACMEMNSKKEEFLEDSKKLAEAVYFYTNAIMEARRNKFNRPQVTVRDIERMAAEAGLIVTAPTPQSLAGNLTDMHK